MLDTILNKIALIKQEKTELTDLLNSRGEVCDESTSLCQYAELYAEALDETIVVNPELDPTLSIEGAAAEAKATGEKINNIQSQIDNIDVGVLTVNGVAPDDNGNVVVEGGSDITIDDTLSVEGAAADAKAVSDALSTMLNAVSQSHNDLRADLTTLDESAVKTVNGVAPDDNGNVAVEGGGSDIVVDDTFTIQGAAADAKAVGDVLAEAETAISQLASMVQNNTNAIGELETQASDAHIREIVDEVINEALAGDY